MTSDETLRPGFDEAVRQFRAFLAREGWPDELFWVRPADLERRLGEPVTVYARPDTDGADDAHAAFEAARRAGRSVRLEAACVLGDKTCAIVTREPAAHTTTAEPLTFAVAPARLEAVIRWPCC